VAFNLILNRLLTKVEVLETNSKNNNLNSAMANQYIDSNFLSLFPIQNKNEFSSVESMIVNEANFVLKLVCYVYKKLRNLEFLFLFFKNKFRNHSLKVLVDVVPKIIYLECCKNYSGMNLPLYLRGLDMEKIHSSQ